MLIVYASNSQSYIEVANINDNMEVSNVQPISEDTLFDINQFIKSQHHLDEIKEGYFVPYNLLYVNEHDINTELIWYVQSRRQTLKFSSKPYIRTFNIPTTVFHLKNKSLFLYITPEKIPNINSVIFKAPYPNIYNDDKICFGNCKLKEKGSPIELIKEYTDFLFESNFSTETNNEYWDLAKNKAFPQKYFKDFKPLSKIKNLIK